MHIAVTGNIGAGKTTLTTMLSKHYGWEAQFGRCRSQSLFGWFLWWYVQMEFCTSDLFPRKQIPTGKGDPREWQKCHPGQNHLWRCTYFCWESYEMNLLSERDFKNYLSVFQLMKDFVSAPDLLIYLRADIPTLVKQIAKRGREYRTQHKHRLSLQTE